MPNYTTVAEILKRVRSLSGTRKTCSRLYLSILLCADEIGIASVPLRSRLCNVVEGLRKMGQGHDGDKLTCGGVEDSASCPCSAYMHWPFKCTWGSLARACQATCFLSSDMDGKGGAAQPTTAHEGYQAEPGRKHARAAGSCKLRPGRFPLPCQTGFCVLAGGAVKRESPATPGSPARAAPTCLDG